MMINDRYWFFGRRFFPLFSIQVLGAFADNVIKTALTFFITYGGFQLGYVSQDFALLLAAAALVVPFVVLSGYAGALADSIDKRTIIVGIRVFEVGLACLALIGFYVQSGDLLLLVIIGYGAQSAIFGPVKFASLPALIGKGRLISANALFEASTFMAIIIGVILGGLLGNDYELSLYAGYGLIATAIISTLLALCMPKLPSSAEGEVAIGLWVSTLDSLKAVMAVKSVFRSVIGLAFFWAIGLVVLTLFPESAQSLLNISPEAATLLIVAFVVGIGLGSLCIALWLRGEISARFVPFGLFLMAIGLALLGIAIETFALQPLDGKVIGAHQLLLSFDGYVLFGSMAFVAFSGGMFTVPLYAIIQADSPSEFSARTIAGNNIVTGILMLVMVGLTSLLNLIGLTFIDFIYVFSALSIVAMLYSFLLVPLESVKCVLSFVIRLIFRTEVRGLEHVNVAEPKVIVANHISLLDGLVLCSCLPGRAAIAVHEDYANSFWVRFGKLFFDIVEVDLDGRMALRTMVNAARNGSSVLIFPEGRITTTGGLERIMPGASTVAMLGDLPILPVRIQGFEHSVLNRMKGKMRRRLFPKARVTIMPSVRLNCPERYKGREARLWAEHELSRIMIDMMAATEYVEPTLFEALIDASKRHGKGVILEDGRAQVGYKRLFVGAFALGRKLSAFAPQGERVGLMLPTSVGAALSFFGCLAYGRIPTMMNFTAGASTLVYAAKLTRLKTVVTSRLFVEKANLDEQVAALSEVVDIVYLEDLRNALSKKDKLRAFAQALRPKHTWRDNIAKSIGRDDEAVVLFTSGSDGMPKAVSLSHGNLLMNYCQVKSVIGLYSADRVMSVLPVFHAFGLYISFVLAPLIGARTFLYPSPLHTKIIPALCYDWNATIFFAADTFLANYARVANPYDFRSLRLVVAGAERLKPTTKDIWARKFGLRILEGYGVTEASPAISVNTPLNNREGTVGQLLPGMEARLETVEGIEEGGRLFVRGGNIMRGYINPDAPEELIPLERFIANSSEFRGHEERHNKGLEPSSDSSRTEQALEGGWYDTGDIVSLDEEGYITIKGRAKRFAKVGGEMVSLTQIEVVAGSLWPLSMHAAVAIPHPRKGEQIMLFTQEQDADLRAYKQASLEAGLADVALPSQIIWIETIPLLGSGKTDYKTLTNQASQSAHG